MRARIRTWIVGAGLVCAGVASAQPQGPAPDAPDMPGAPEAPKLNTQEPVGTTTSAPSTFTLRRKLALGVGVVGEHPAGR